MKKILILAMATAVALSSCSKNEITISSLDNQEIGFSTYTGLSTKGSEVTTGTLQSSTDGFGVFAYYTSASSFVDGTSTPNFMYNQQVKYSNSSWAYSPMKYWPNNTTDAISFFAYAPYQAYTATPSTTATAISFDSVSDMAGAPALTYSIGSATTAKDLVDLVVAAPSYNNYNNTAYNSTKESIGLSFSHVLTRASFSAYISNSDFDTSNTKVFVKTMKIVSGTQGTSTCIDRSGSTVLTPSNGFYNSAAFNYASSSNDDTSYNIDGVGSWSYDNATSVSADFDFSSLLSNSTTETLLGDSDSGYDQTTGVEVVSVASTSPTSLFIQDGEDVNAEYLFLIPANGSTGIVNDKSNVYVYIEYDVVTVDEKLENGYSVVTNKDVITLGEGTLKAGVSYNYILTIGFDEVTVTAEVTAWDDDVDDTITTPEILTEVPFSVTLSNENNTTLYESISYIQFSGWDVIGDATDAEITYATSLQGGVSPGITSIIQTLDTSLGGYSTVTITANQTYTITTFSGSSSGVSTSASTTTASLSSIYTPTLLTSADTRSQHSVTTDEDSVEFDFKIVSCGDVSIATLQ